MKGLKLIILFSLLVSFSQIWAQSDESDDHSVYFSIHGGAFHASKKTASYYDGTGTNNIAQVIGIPTVYNQIYNQIGYSFTIGSYPYEPRYRIGLDLGIDVGWWLSAYSALTLGVSYNNLKFKEAFTLEADNPANPNGDPLVFIQQILATEQRFQIDLGMHHDVGGNEKYMTFFEWGGNFAALKPVKHEILVEQNLRYNLMYQINYFNIVPKTELGYGGFVGFGCRMAFPKNMALDFGGKLYLQKLKLGDKQGFMFSQLIFMRVVYK